MSRLAREIRNAFAVDPPGDAEPTSRQRVIIDVVCREVVRRHLTAPALIFLEVSRPLNYVGAQTMRFFEPIVTAVIDGHGFIEFAKFLECRGSIDYLCHRIEHFEHGRRKARAPEASQPDASAAEVKHDVD